jgi:predicted esterase
VASWMTRQDRELTIGDNLAYVAAVIEAVKRDHRDTTGLVFAGFSQGVAMAFRAAASAPDVNGVIAVGGDVPPELSPADLARVRHALVCHGARDAWYTLAAFEGDVRRLSEAGVAVHPLEFDGGHEWTEDVAHGASLFLHERLS